MKNKDLNFYINIGFVICILIFTSLFFKDFIFEDATVVGSAISGFIGIIVAGSLFLLLKKQSLYIKITVIICFIIVIALFSNHYNGGDLRGSWISMENNRSCELTIDDKNIIMTYSTENDSRTYEYERERKFITLYNDDELIMIEWHILKIEKDSLVIQEINTILGDKESGIHRFVKE